MPIRAPAANGPLWEEASSRPPPCTTGARRPRSGIPFRWCFFRVALPTSPPSVQAVLFLFLASGRNPQYLITHHMEAAPHLHRWGLEVIPTTYLLLDTGGPPTAAHYMTQTFALPTYKPELIVAAALAGLYLGQRLLYVDAGSGAASPPTLEAIRALRALTPYPILVGGGIQTPQQLADLVHAGATFTVLGTLPEKHTPSRTFWEELFYAAQIPSPRC
jgi:phosphoglycerol geranylgeranyltransferase